MFNNKKKETVESRNKANQQSRCLKVSCWISLSVASKNCGDVSETAMRNGLLVDVIVRERKTEAQKCLLPIIIQTHGNPVQWITSFICIVIDKL